jgi:hypothetical protein
MKRCMMTMCIAALVVSAASAQSKKAVPPPPKPADSGPSLEVTMKFIQDKMNDQGTVGYVTTQTNLNGVLFRIYYVISDAVADASTCNLRLTEKTTTQIEVANGTTYNENGKPVSGDDLSRVQVETSTSSFKDVGSIAVESSQDAGNRRWAQAAHPEVTLAFTPAVYSLALNGTKKDAFSFHVVFNRGKQPPQEFDQKGKENTFTFRDEDAANRVAKAMLHAVELCGGGKAEPF